MRKFVPALVITTAFLALVGVSPAGADPAQEGEGAAYGIQVSLAGSELIPATPEATATAPPFPEEDSAETTLPIDADPLAVNGTLNAAVALHSQADIGSSLEVEEQALAGPYNAAAVASVEDLEVLIDAVDDDIPLVEADLLRGEVVAKCTGEDVEYSAQSEAVNLVVGGNASLGDLANDLIDQLFPSLDPLDPIVDVEETVVTDLPGGGLAVDALVITLLEAAGETPLAQVRLGHAELSGVSCGAGGAVPECSDTSDNDGDGVIDAEDPGCHTDGDATNPDSYDPDDDDETDDASGGTPACSDTEDNDGDGVIDAEDPGCHTDGDATNPDSYDANDTTEDDGPDVQAGEELPATGSAVPLAGALGLGLAAAAIEGVRRRAAG
jgi:hypothetical protein